MLTKYEWIATDKQFFGQPNTAYDFEAADMKEVSRRLGRMQEQKVCGFSVLPTSEFKGNIGLFLFVAAG